MSEGLVYKSVDNKRLACLHAGPKVPKRRFIARESNNPFVYVRIVSFH